MFARLQTRPGRRDTEERDGNARDAPGGFSPARFFPFSSAPVAPAGSPPTSSADVPSQQGARSSRASSVISTRTGVTIGTLQDDTRSVRSIDLTLGGRLFHINRDASRISVTEEERLPPYSPPAPAYSQPVDMEVAPTPGRASPSPRTLPLDIPPTGSVPPDSEDGSVLQSASLSRGPDTIVGSHNPAEHRETVDSMSPSSLNRAPGRTPRLPMRRSASVDHVPGHEHRPRDTASTTRRLRRRKSFSLPKPYVNNHDNAANLGDHNLGGRRALPNLDTTVRDDMSIQSAGPSFGRRESQQHALSPMYIRNAAAESLPESYRPRISRRAKSDSNRPWLEESQSQPPIAVSQSRALVEEGDVRTETSPTMDSENDISIHYSRLIRSIDRDHRQALHVRDKELATTRERLNELDQVYRNELRTRDFTIDDLQKRLTNLERQLQSRIEQAQNNVEDEWEKRWKHRDRHLMERMRRMELDSQKQVERSVAQRDEEWVAQLQKQNSELFEKLGLNGVRSEKDEE